MIDYKNLTEYQKVHICNACGPKWLPVKLPDFLFTANCHHHDFLYWRGERFGFKRLARLKADVQFFLAMLNDVEACPAEDRYVYFRWAFRYFKAVRILGWTAFNWGRMKTQEDLDKIKGGSYG